MIKSKNWISIPLEKLIKAPWNYKKDDDEKAAKLTANMRKNGQVENIIVRPLGRGKYEVVNGNHRIDSFHELGTKEIICFNMRESSVQEAERLAIETNETHFDSDDDKLSGLLRDIKTEFDLSDISSTMPFTDDELNEMLGEHGGGGEGPGDGDPPARIDEAEELQKKWKVKTGQLWEMGGHLLLCGDVADEKNIKLLLGGEKNLMLLTDPPYGVNRDKGFAKVRPGAWSTSRRFENDNWDKERPGKLFFDNLIKVAGISVIWGGNFFADFLPRSTHWIFWDKVQTMPTFGDGELAWTNSTRKSVSKITIQWCGLIGKEKERFHPTQKPVELMVWCIDQYAKKINCIFDPYLGSGTTLIACQQTDKKCFGMEIAPKYVAVALQRYQDATGNTPTLKKIPKSR